MTGQSTVGGSRPALAVPLLVLVLCASAGAKVTPGFEDWGIGGAVKSGLWSQLYVELTSVGEDFEGRIEVVIEAGQTTLPVFVKPVALVRDTPTRHWVYFRAPGTVWRRPGQTFLWRLLDRRDRVVLRSRWANAEVFPTEDTCIVAMRGQNVPAAGLGALVDPDSEVRTHVRMLSAPVAPDRVAGYDSTDALVWINPDPAQFTPAQVDALTEFVRRGGHLVLAAGSEWQALVGSFLADLLPARPTASAAVTGMTALNEYGDVDLSDAPIVLAQLADVRGEVLMDCAGKPAVVRGRCGYGVVTLLAFDPTKAPFANLKDRGRFWRETLRIDTPEVERQNVGTLANASIPLVRSLNDFPGFEPINFTFVTIFLIVYIVLIGPVDYFVLKRLRKLHWTWLTFPAVAVVCSVLAFGILSSGRVSALFANSISIVDASHDDGEIVGSTFTTFLSPRQTRYDVALAGVTDGAVLPREFETMGGPSPGGGLGQSKCFVGLGGEWIHRMLIRVWDAQTLQASWTAERPELPGVDLAWQGNALACTIENGTSDHLDNLVVLTGGRAFHLGDVAPGRKRTLRDRGAKSVADAARAVTPEDFRERRHHGERFARDEADGCARWVSLFSYAGKDANGDFRRYLPPGENAYRSTAFDFPRRIALDGLDARDRAVVLYTVKRSFGAIRLAGHSPQTWDMTLVRLRVPVRDAAKPEGDDS